MNKQHFLWIFIFCPVLGFGQIIDDIGLSFGSYLNMYDIEDKKGFSNATNSEEVSLFVDVSGKKYVNDRVAYDVGLGVSREYLGFNPFINLTEVNSYKSSNFDTLTIAEVGNWDWQLRFRIGVSLDLFDQIDVLPPFITIPGMRLTAGLTNKITFNRINTDNIIIGSYDAVNRSGYEYYNESLNNSVSDYYSEHISYYKLMMNLGVEFFQIIGTMETLFGIKYTRHLISPVASDIKNKFAATIYIGLYYKINKRHAVPARSLFDRMRRNF